MNESFSEYILYEPALRILMARGFAVQCEYPCPGFTRAGPGDVKKLDFVAEGSGTRFAIEMKWARTHRLDVASDVEKLRRFKQATPGELGFLCVFGRKSILHQLSIQPFGVREQGGAVYAEFGITRYGCRVYEVIDGAPLDRLGRQHSAPAGPL
jgi:Holliday junction resolvase